MIRRRMMALAVPLVACVALVVASSDSAAAAPGDPGTIATLAGGGIADGSASTDGPFHSIGALNVAADGTLYVATGPNHCRVRAIDPLTSIVDTVAGNDECSANAPDGPASTTPLGWIRDLDLTPAGDLVLVDASSCRIRTVAAGVVSTVAGTGECEFAGDGGPALDAKLRAPDAARVNAAGDILVADGCRIRSIAAATGIITTIAGDGSCTHSGDDGDPLSAGFDANAIALDGDDIYLMDPYACRVRKIAAGVITTVLGNGVCSSTGPDGAATEVPAQPGSMAITGAAELVVAEGCRIRVVAGGAVTTMSGGATCGFSGDGGPASNAQLGAVAAVAAHGADAFVADGCRVRKIALGNIDTIAGAACVGSGDGGSLHNAGLLPTEVEGLPGGGILVGGAGPESGLAGECAVRLIAAGTISTVVGDGSCVTSGDGGPATAAGLSPGSIAVRSDGSFYVEDKSTCRVRLVSAGIITTAAGDGVCGYNGDSGAPGALSLGSFLSLAVGPADELYIADYDNCIIRKLSGDSLDRFAGTPGSCGFSANGTRALDAVISPGGVAVDDEGTLYFTSFCRVHRIKDGVLSTVAGGLCSADGDGGAARAAGLRANHGDIEMGHGGTVFFREVNGCRVRRIDGEIINLVTGSTCGYGGDGGFATAAKLGLFGPAGLAVVGDDLHIADTFNHRTRVVYGQTADHDDDNVINNIDNCPLIANVDQSNADTDLIDLAPYRTYDDATWPNSDPVGNACDADDDNDGRSDVDELSGQACGAGIRTTGPHVRDSDGDLAIDGAECVLGFDPTDALNTPTSSDCGPSNDFDGDGIPHNREVCGYGSAFYSADTDSDGCPDGREAASVNEDRRVNIIDLQQTAQSFGPKGSAAYAYHFDMDRNGAVNVIDLKFVVGQFGVCGA